MPRYWKGGEVNILFYIVLSSRYNLDNEFLLDWLAVFELLVVGLVDTCRHLFPMFSFV